MNSPDYDDFIDIFSVPTPVLPLPPNAVSSPSHEQSQDVIYDSLPPMEQSTVPESLLKYLLPERLMSKRLIQSLNVFRDPGKDEMRKDGTRNEGMSNEGHETPGCIEDPISDPVSKA
ncbi:hypothetical protein TNCV_2431671 [Trichonephila clavipes]|nr:hypothetical protein TNCV_2431671 [Trichonephila clavipes]